MSVPPNEEDSRIRAVFGHSNNDPIPRVDHETLLTYREFLVANLSFPFEALYADTMPPVRQLVRYVVVTGLSHAHHHLDGLLCRVQNAHGEVEMPLAALGVHEENPNHQLVDDYAYWFWNWR